MQPIVPSRVNYSMTPQNNRPGTLPALSTLLVPVTLGILVLGMALQMKPQTPHGGARGPQESVFQGFVFRDGPQPQPAACNKAMTLYLQAEYRLYQRCLAQARPLAPEYRRLTREAVEGYNQVAGDTDPSAFDMTTLPRHLDDSKL